MMSLKNYIECAKSRLKYALTVFEAAPEAGSFPCELCCGEGVLVRHFTFARLRKSDEPLQKKDGTKIVCTDLIPCPTCAGSGVNQDALNKSILESEAA